MGIEPTSKAWEAFVLPLNYTRVRSIAVHHTIVCHTALFLNTSWCPRGSVAMKIIVNGEEKVFPAPITVAGLLEEMGLSENRVAVEVNQEIVPRSLHGKHRLEDSDQVEVVRAIGGG